MTIDKILSAFGYLKDQFQIERINAGYINQTYKLTGEKSFVLQRVNINVFRKPEVVASNLREAANHLAQHYPDYLFLSGVRTIRGEEMVYDEEGYPWRLFPYIANTITINRVETEEEAFNAARGFARLAKNLSGCDPSKFKPTIDRFHDLGWRYEQFEDALANATADRGDRIEESRDAIEAAQRFSYLVDRYHALIEANLPVRVLHNDTKINNILFDAATRQDVCVIDLDTLMPGYFMYDLGDMIRTFVSPVDEEEQDLSKVIVRRNIYDALVRGYLSEMDKELTDAEKESIDFSGQMMTYIMALRMLADYLNGDVYYHTTYPKQNLIRARNQFTLLSHLADKK